MASKRSVLNKVIDQDMKTREYLDLKDTSGFRGSRKKVTEKMKQHNFRMKQSEYTKLVIHFQKELNLSAAQGIRMILTQYAKNIGIF